MTTNLTVSVAASVVAVMSFAGVPQATNVVLSQDAENNAVTIDYALAESAIITADIQTNSAAGWVSLGGTALRSMTGDVHRLVDAGPHTISWPTLPDGSKIPTLPSRKRVRAVITTWVTNAPPDYLVLDLSNQESPAYYAEEEMLPYGGSVTNDKYKENYLVMKRIHAAGVTWLMGTDEAERTEAAAVPHEVMLTRDYYIGVYPVTEWQETYLWPGYATSKTHLPASPLNKGYAELLCRNAASITGISGFALPTEAQWEFAARGGCPTEFYTGKPLTDANLVELGGKWSGSRHEVGKHTPNGYGLHDMLGCIQQPVRDYYESWSTCNAGGPISRQPAIVDPQGPATGSETVFRGGFFGWGTPQNNVSHRSHYSTSQEIADSLGARLALPL